MKQKDFEELDKAVKKQLAQSKKQPAVLSRPTNRGLYMDFMGPGMRVTPPAQKVGARPQAVVSTKPLPIPPVKTITRPPIVRTMKRIQSVKSASGEKTSVVRDVRIERITEEVVRKPLVQKTAAPSVKIAPKNAKLAPEAKIASTKATKTTPVKEKPAVKETAKTTDKAKTAKKDTSAPDANNYVLGGRSPFLTDTKIEKRPLGRVVPDGNAYEIRSTKNVYSQRSFTSKESSINDRPIIVSSAKKSSGWVWAIVTLSVIAVGAGIGVLLYFAFAN